MKDGVMLESDLSCGIYWSQSLSLKQTGSCERVESREPYHWWGDKIDWVGCVMGQLFIPRRIVLVLPLPLSVLSESLERWGEDAGQSYVLPSVCVQWRVQWWWCWERRGEVTVRLRWVSSLELLLVSNNRKVTAILQVTVTSSQITPQHSNNTINFRIFKEWLL